MTDYAALIRLLVDHQIDFIVVGGAAATAHGSARLTLDLDIVYSRDGLNLERIVRALEPIQPYLRGAPPGLPFEWSVETLKKGLNFTLITILGALDLLGEIVGGGGYEETAIELVVDSTVVRRASGPNTRPRSTGIRSNSRGNQASGWPSGTRSPGHARPAS